MYQIHTNYTSKHVTFHSLFLVLSIFHFRTYSPSYKLIWDCYYDRRAGMAQWWERLPPTYVTLVRFRDRASYVGWVCCWYSTLLWEAFLWVLQFSPPLKNQHFQIPIGPWSALTFVGKQITSLYFTLLCIFLNIAVLYLKHNYSMCLFTSYTIKE